MDTSCSEFSFVILPARPAHGFAQLELYNTAYLHWKEYWTRTFQRKAPDFWDPRDFFRQDLVSCLFWRGKVAAQNLSTFLHIDHAVTCDLPYFQSFKGAAERIIRAEGAKKLMTIEYTSVHRDFGERKVGFRLAEVINGLGLKLFLQHGADVTTGTPRTASGLSEVTRNYGYRLVEEGIQKAGWILDSYLGFRGEVNDHPDPKYRSIIDRLWQDREDLSLSEKARHEAEAPYRSQFQNHHIDPLRRQDEFAK